LLVGVTALPAAIVPLAMVLRMGASAAQTWLNLGLDKREPGQSATRMDGLLIAATVAGVYFAVIANRISGAPFSLPLLLPMMAPFTLLQVQMARRSYALHRRTRVRVVALSRIEQFVSTAKAA